MHIESIMETKTKSLAAGFLSAEVSIEYFVEQTKDEAKQKHSIIFTRSAIEFD